MKYEKSYDTFHPRAADIYRVEYDNWQNGKLRFECAAAVPAVGPALKNNFPRSNGSRDYFPVDGVMTYESPVNGVVAHREAKMQITDSSVFKVFGWKLVKGNVNEVLKGPGKVVISETAARKYFGAEDPMGKTYDLGRRSKVRSQRRLRRRPC